jgi:hypothetical protein
MKGGLALPRRVRSASEGDQVEGIKVLTSCRQPVLIGTRCIGLVRSHGCVRIGGRRGEGATQNRSSRKAIKGVTLLFCLSIDPEEGIKWNSEEKSMVLITMKTMGEGKASQWRRRSLKISFDTN